MAQEKGSGRTIFEGVATATIVGVGSWGVQFVPVIGKWLTASISVPVWGVLGILLALLVAFATSVRLVVAGVPRPSSAVETAWTPDGLHLSVLKLLRAIDGEEVTIPRLKKLLALAGEGDWPESDTSLALRELCGAGYASPNYHSGRYHISDKGTRFAQKHGLPVLSQPHLDELNQRSYYS